VSARRAHAAGIADLAGRDLAALDIVHLPVSLTPAERVAYERDIEAFTRLRRELRRANPDADWVTCVRTIACMPGDTDVLVAMRRAAALAASESAIAPSIGRRPPSVSGTIDLDDELHRRRSKVGNEPPDNHLPPKSDTELPPAQIDPKRRLRLCHVRIGSPPRRLR
jgi:hypothetical protein